MSTASLRGTAKAQARPSAAFPLGEVPDPETGKPIPRMIEVYKPDETDMVILIRVERMMSQAERRDDGRVMIDAVGTFADVLDSLIVDPDDRRYAMDVLVDRSVGLDEYFGLASLVMRHFGEQDEAPRTGPVKATKRATRRAR
jgi:hypothetical protein